MSETILKEVVVEVNKILPDSVNLEKNGYYR